MRDTRRSPGRASLLALLVVAALLRRAHRVRKRRLRPASRGCSRFALAEDPDPLDPTTSGTFVSRIVYVDMCEKLYDVGPKLQIVPQLATALPTVSKDSKTLTIPLRSGVRFNDGTPFNAQAVKTTLEHYITYKESSRAGDLASVASVEVVDADTVKLHLEGAVGAAPVAARRPRRDDPVADRSSRSSAARSSRRTRSASARSSTPTASPATTSRSTSRRTTTTRDKVHLKRIIFKIITDGPVRASNLRSGDVDVAERLEPFDVVSIKGDSSIHLQTTTSIGYQGITINTGNTDGTGKPFHPGKVKTPLGRAPRAARGVRGRARPRASSTRSSSTTRSRPTAGRSRP